MRSLRRWLALALLPLLAGCGPTRDAREFEAWRARIAAAEKITFDAAITAHWEDAATTFTVRVEHRGGETMAEITAPEPIAGIAFHRSSETDWLVFDDLILDLDAGHINAVAPCEAPARLLAAILDGMPRSFGRDGDGSIVALEGQDGENVTLWRSPDGTPYRAEIERGGVTELTMKIENWDPKR